MERVSVHKLYEYGKADPEAAFPAPTGPHRACAARPNAVPIEAGGRRANRTSPGSFIARDKICLGDDNRTFGHRLDGGEGDVGPKP